MRIKKGIAILVALLVIFQGVSALAFTDTDGTRYEKAANILQKFGITNGYEDKTFRPDGELSRAEFAAMIVRILGEENYEATKEQIFTDVNKKHWAFETVSKAKATGYFAGLGDGSFAPDEKITYAQAVKVMVSMLGYQQWAEAVGGYPAGYMTIAAQKDLLKGVSGTGDMPISRGNVAILIYNSLDKPMLTQSIFGDEVEEFTEDPDRTILTEKLGCEKYEGIVQATDITSIGGYKTAVSGKVIVGGVTLNAAKSGIGEYLGYELEVYAKEVKNDEMEVVFFEQTINNNVIEVAAEDIDNRTNFNVLYYWEDDKDKVTDVKIQGAECVINGKYETFYVVSDIKPTSGTLKLIDNNGDETYDVIFVKEYKHYVVEKIDSEYLVIYDKYCKEPIELTKEGNAVEYKILRKGSNAKFNNIIIGSVLSVLQSRDGEYIEIDIVTNPVRGTVTGTDGDKYLIGEQYYERSADLPDSEIININDSGTFYLDAEGKIIYLLTSTPSQGRYFLMLNAKIEGNTEKVLKIRVLDADGNIKTFDVARRATFDGSYRTHEQILSALGGENVAKSPYRYALNAEGQITELYTPSLDFASASRRMKRGGMIFGYNGSSTFFLQEEAVVFQVPQNGGAEEDYKILPLTAFANRGYYTIEAYDVEDFASPCAIVTVADASAVELSISNISSVVTEVKTIMDAEGFPIKKFKTLYDGKASEVTLTEDTRIISVDMSTGVQTDISADSIQVGDVIQVKVDTLGIPTAVGKLVLDPEKQFIVSRGLSGERIFGRIVKVAGNGILVEAVKDGTPVQYLYVVQKLSGGLYAIERGTDKAPRIITMADVMDTETMGAENAPYVFLTCTDGSTNEIILIYDRTAE